MVGAQSVLQTRGVPAAHDCGRCSKARGLYTSSRRRLKLPSLAKEGWPRHQKISRSSSEVADGVVCSSSRELVFEQSTPSARSKVASYSFLDSRIHPSLA